MRVNILYFNQFCMGKYMEKEDQAEEEYHDFKI